jgi:hypothetical protein
VVVRLVSKSSSRDYPDQGTQVPETPSVLKGGRGAHARGAGQHYQCSRCGETKLLSEFPERNRGYCLACKKPGGRPAKG